MTSWLLDLLVHARGPLSRQLLLAGLIAAVLPLTLCVDAARAYRRASRRARALAQPFALCPRRHRVELMGSWACACGFTFDGHAFDRCPLDGAIADFVLCACGAAVENPLRDQRGT